ncbi:hypothetical protein PPOP_3715, partial [Paenibacillus popilliae ATCC 14706]
KIDLAKQMLLMLTRQATSGLRSISIPEIDMKCPYSAVDQSEQKGEDPATYNDAYLLISNRYDVPEEVLMLM